MCGIVGTLGKRHTLETAVEALKRLEYRGYDSFGVSTLQASGISTKKAVGSVTEHAKSGFFGNVKEGESVIAHTRWATHGGVTEANAHPHVSFDGAFSLVHNGVIENYQELASDLRKQGIKLSSQTDTEVIVHLLAVHYRKSKNVLDALYKTLDELKGEFAIVFITVHDPAHLYAAKLKSPLGYGHARGLGIVASDQRALGPLTPNITFLEDGDVLVLSRDSAEVYARKGHGYKKIRRTSTILPWAGDDDSLDGYTHHMLKEIHEAPVAIENALKIKDDTIQSIVDESLGKNVSITGAGSAFYVSQIGQYYFAQLAGVYTHTHPSDEILSLVAFSKKDHLIAVSQSGETFDTLEVIRSALKAGGAVTSINNVYGSSCQRIATHPIFQGAGTEVCVLSTKSIISQTLILYRIAKYLGKKNGTISAKKFAELSADEKKLIPTLNKFFAETEKKIKETAGWNRHVDNWFFIGRGFHYPIAMESALKFKEVSYLHAEGMPAGFFKHGTISLIDDRFYTVAFLPSKKSDEDIFRFTISNVSEIHARGGHVIAIGHDKDISDAIDNLYDYVALPSINRFLDPIFELIAGQLLAYYCAAALGRNIDKPRALAKSVTVR
jgi:glucosamine--fructose-6-phosphate aminotransferase (isomerizing)